MLDALGIPEAAVVPLLMIVLAVTLVLTVVIIAIAIDSKNGPRRDGPPMNGSGEVHDFY